MHLLLFLLAVLLFTFTTTALPSSHLLPRALIRGSDTPAAIALSARYAVRWMDPNQGLYGATLNLSFAQPTLFAQRWAVRFRLADNATQVKEYWGSWQVLELVRGWYQISPKEDLRLNDVQQVYFSFNGVWNTTRGDWNTTKLAATALEVQVSEANNPKAIPTVYQLRDAGEFANEPVPFEIPAAPFGNFVRNAARPGIPVVRMNGELPRVPPVMPTSNFIGTYIVLPLLSLFCAIWMMAIAQSWKWRRVYRMQLAEVSSKQVALADHRRSSGISGDDEQEKKPTGYDNAYAGYYMMMDGAWDDQVVRDGDENPVDMYGRPYSVAPVVTDAYPHAASQGGRRRTTVLIPGKEYRLTLLEKGVPMPAGWLPPRLQQKQAAASYDQRPPHLASDTEFHTPPETFAPSSMPESYYPTMPPVLPPIARFETGSENSTEGPAAVQSRSLVGNRMRKDVIKPQMHIAETVPAVEGAVEYTAQERETMIPRFQPTLDPPAASTQPTHTVGVVHDTVPSNAFLQIHPQAFDSIPLSPGWPIGEEEGSAYSPSVMHQPPPPPPGTQHGTGASPPRAGLGNGSGKPLPAVGGWNMI